MVTQLRSLAHRALEEPSNRRRRNACCAALLALALAPAAQAQIRWRSGEGGSPRAATTGQRGLGVVRDQLSSSDRRHLVIRFDAPITAPDRAQLAHAGIFLEGYLGGNAYFAAVDPAPLGSAPVGAVPQLVSAAPVATAHKLHPYLARGARPTWALRPAPAPDRPAAPSGELMGAYLLFFPDVTDAEITKLAQAHGIIVHRRLLSVPGIVAELPFAALSAIASEDAVQYVEPALPPLRALNDSNRALTEADSVQAAPYGLDGAGVDVLVYDAGTARDTHVDFGGRLAVRDASGMADHSTHVSGTIGGDGTASGGTWRGMAPAVTIESYGFETGGPLQAGFLYTDPGDIEADYDEAINVYGADIANNSIGTNTAPNGFPCTWEGDYGVTDAVIDSIVAGGLGKPFRIVWANGNERQGSQSCGAGYHTTAPPACAKNHITVGALNSNDDSVTAFTSWGPADDGRLKPDISAPGCQVGADGGVTSTSASSDTGYTTFCGTSMAAPTVTGLSALLLQDYRAQYPGAVDFRNATLKALLAHNAEDIAAPGPDYQTGYGSVRIRRTIDFMRTGRFLEAAVGPQGTYALVAIVAPGDAALKLTLAWDDPPGTPNVLPALVNDLDIRVFDPTGAQHFPWTLGGLADPAAPAVRSGPDRVNNLEQVLVDAPASGLWRVEVFGYSVPQGPQTFSLCVSAPILGDCNTNGVADMLDVAGGTSADCNFNSVPDECEPAADCNANGVTDLCDIGAGTSADINSNSIADECEPDCNANTRPDDYDIATGASTDCNGNSIPDECDLAGGSSVDCDANALPDECQPDCNANAIADACDLASGASADCDLNGVPDECQRDCNQNGIPDDCDIAAGSSLDQDQNGYPDECRLLFVRADAAGDNDGTNWTDAYIDLQDALAFARSSPQIDEIWVAEGAYTPAAPGGNIYATFALPDGVALYGGFAGTETRREQRDWMAHPTVLSGDLNGDDGPEFANRVDNSRTIITGDGLGAANLDGFIVHDGYATTSPGAGLRLTNCQARIANCRFEQNVTSFYHGGAVYAQDGYALFTGCVFNENYVHLGKGGGIYLYGTATADIADCTFTGNTSVGSTSGTPEGAGAAIAHWADGPLTIVDSVFDNNVSRGFYTSGTNGAYAGAIDHFGPGPLFVDRCVFTDNASNAGGAIFSWRDLTITNSVFARNHAPQFNSSVGWGGQGGAVACNSFAGTTVTVANCVFFGNSSEDAGGIGAYNAAQLSVANSILWNNTDNRGNVGKSQVSSAQTRYCCIMNMLVAAPGDDPPDPAHFPGCIDAEPLFEAPAATDFHLQAGSPCIDAGDSAALPFAALRDLDGRFRFRDDPATPDTGPGIAPVVDMGALEFGSIHDGDYDGDGDVDLDDFLFLPVCLTGPAQGPVATGCAPLDLDADDDVDLLDVARFHTALDPAVLPLLPPALISGSVAYSGAAGGPIVVRAMGVAGTSWVFETTRSTPGAYQLSIDHSGNYRLFAFIDVDTDGLPDAGEPRADYTANPVGITTSGQTLAGADFSLGGAYSITGRVTWGSDPGSGAWNIPMQLSGTAQAETTTDGDGNYAFTQLGDGDYTVTPVSAARYFYPYFQSVTVAGATVSGVDFTIHTLPTGDVDGEDSGTVLAIDPAGYNLTLDVGGGSLTLYVYADTLFSGDASSLADIEVGWDVMAQYWTSDDLATEIDAQAP